MPEQQLHLRLHWLHIIISNVLLIFILETPADSQFSSSEVSPIKDGLIENTFDLPSEIIEDSPVLKKWLNKIPNVLYDIHTDPSFRTRVGIGYAEFPSTEHEGGINIGVDDIFIGKTGLTISGDYQTSFRRRDAGGLNLQYYLLPLGNYINVAPMVGYRSIYTNDYSESGFNIGGKLVLPLSRTGASDISLSHSFISPGEDTEVGIITISFGYAITKNIRLATKIERQNSQIKKDSKIGIMFELMP
ncbi:MAG: hypothetical protein ACTMUB_05110 [cyanobacterium endosymbiont of Rhopalodia musculus]|uniref:hypothetical protein n=1 Tax=cyanobacterium endosymbiont of Epithemia clementina EcSB TaxID=3034674 RepID=UPI002480738D|nr:hypothetical protein [cyanobacterium endosymbiont of Epithemia clementina EcSB]WGT67534.1 hypothetical protein P3F56_10195 [cyanobacterium endosymbiont of Epithemia clementina EcSB]